jgi:hypothetical protein
MRYSISLLIRYSISLSQYMYTVECVPTGKYTSKYITRIKWRQWPVRGNSIALHTGLVWECPSACKTPCNNCILMENVSLKSPSKISICVLVLIENKYSYCHSLLLNGYVWLLSGKLRLVRKFVKSALLKLEKCWMLQAYSKGTCWKSAWRHDLAAQRGRKRGRRPRRADQKPLI